MSYEIQNIPSYRVAYMRQIGPYGSKNFTVMGKLKAWAQQNHLLNNTSILLGISMDHPQRTLPQHCRFDAGIVIDNHFTPDESVDVKTIEGGTYFIYSVQHTNEHIQEAWSSIMSIIYKQGYQLDDRPVIERYVGYMDNKTFCDLCVPIICNDKMI